MKFTFSMILVFAVAITLGLLGNKWKENQCEHNGLGEWHYWTQVCEPVRP